MFIHVMKTVVIIPARYASTRFPGKPLVDINGKPMIQHTFERACQAKNIHDVFIATEDKRIKKAAQLFTDNVVMTSVKHNTGTERCAEALRKIKVRGITHVINVQGDEPFIHPNQIDKLAEILQKNRSDIATLAIKIKDAQDLTDPNKAKIVMNTAGEAMLFSRSPIPFVRGVAVDAWLEHATFYKHIGIYGFKSKILADCIKLKPTEAEKVESLEQLRWLQHGYSIQVGITHKETIGIDTPEDLLRVKN